MSDDLPYFKNGTLSVKSIQEDVEAFIRALTDTPEPAQETDEEPAHPSPMGYVPIMFLDDFDYSGVVGGPDRTPDQKYVSDPIPDDTVLAFTPPRPPGTVNMSDKDITITVDDETTAKSVTVKIPWDAIKALAPLLQKGNT